VIKVHSRESAYRVEREIYELLSERSTLVPRLLSTGQVEKAMVLVLEKMPGQALEGAFSSFSNPEQGLILKRVGEALANFSCAVPTSELLGAHFWRRHMSSNVALGSWSTVLSSLVTKWLARIDRNTIGSEVMQVIERLADSLSATREPASIGLIHGDAGFRNFLLDPDSRQVTGLVGFEASFIGDARYDLAKLTWNELNWGDSELTLQCGEAWAAAAGDTFEPELHAYYECLQALAAVAWVDRQNRDPTHDDGISLSTRTTFRARALGRLRAAW